VQNGRAAAVKASAVQPKPQLIFAVSHFVDATHWAHLPTAFKDISLA